MKNLMRLLQIIPLIGLLLLTISVAAAQGDNTSGATTILEAINDRRRTQNVAYVVPNETLNQVAQSFAEDLSVRPEGSNADVYLTIDGQNLDTLLESAGFPAYSDGYVADFVPMRLFNVQPDQLITYILQDAALGADRTIASRRMKQGSVARLPLFEPPYREIGIGVTLNESSGRYTYVILMASRPNVLPVVITDPDQSRAKSILTTTDAPDVILRVQNENSHREGDVINGEQMIGLVTSIRISESSEQVDCPANAFDTNNGWQPYNNRPAYTLSDGAGAKTVYVQMCDDEANTVISSADIQFGEAGAATLETDADLLPIVHATQTAAAEATAFAPLRPTVEAILTATAAAP